MPADQDTNDATRIVVVTDAAREKIHEIMEVQGIQGRGAIRVGINGRGPARHATANEQPAWVSSTPPRPHQLWGHGE